MRFPRVLRATPIFIGRMGWGRRGEVVMETTRSPGPWGVPRPFPAEMENPGTSRAAPSGSWRTLEGDPHPQP